jgi:lambda family phage tail tape measure protein
MAQNISVTLTLDDKQYTAKLKAADTATKSFAKSAETGSVAANTAFTKLQGTVDRMTTRIGGLRTALAGLGFLALGSSALRMADDLQDLSNATGIAVGRLLELKKALTTSGGDGEQMGTALNNFLRGIDDAAEGSIKAQNSFAGLGVSMNDLRKLSEQDLFVKTLEGIAAIENPSRRAAEMMDKFGKSFKTVDPQELLDKLRATRGEGDKYAASIERAAKLNDALATAQGNVKIAFIEAFAPIIRQINGMNDALDGTGVKMEGLINIIKVLGIALLTSFAFTIGLKLVAMIGQIGRAFTALGGVITKAGTGAMAGLFAATGTLMVVLRGFVVLIAVVGTSIYAASQLFDDFGSIAVNAAARAVEGIAELAGSILNLGGLLTIGGVGLGTPFEIMAAKAKAARLEAEKATAYDKKIGGGRGTMGGPTAEELAAAGKATITTGGPDARPVDESARKNAIQSVRETNIEFEKQQRLRIAALDFQTRMVGKTEEEKQLAEGQRELYLDYVNTFEQLEKRRLSLSKDELYLGSEIEKQQKELYKIYLDKDKQLEKGITAQQTANLLEKDRLNTLENITKAIDNQVAKQEALAELLRNANEQKFAAKDNIPASQLVGLSSIQKQIVDIQENARKAAQEAAKAFAEKFGEINTTADAQEFADGLDKIATAWRGVAGAQTEVAKTNYDISRSFSTGWTEAFAKYAEDAQNAADQAATYFDRFTKGFEDAVVALVTNGKFSFKDFANSIIADFARIEARKALTSVMSGATPGGSVLGSLFNFGKSLFGFANGGTIGAGMPAIVGERGPELFMPSSGGKIIPNNQLGGQSQVVHTTVNYAIQAVDASSFRSLVARDPSFIYAVTEQGRRSQPTRRNA